MVVCDSSTLIHLSRIGRLHLLRDLYGALTVPAAVWREVVEQGSGRPGVAEVAAARGDGWIEIQSATNEPFLRSLKHDLDEGQVASGSMKRSTRERFRRLAKLAPSPDSRP